METKAKSRLTGRRRGQRTTRPQDYFEAGMALLSAAGSEALTIASVCARLKVTKGSFYYHFHNWDDFVDRLLASWTGTQTERIIALAGAEGDVARQLDLLVDFASRLPHGAEAAIRAWGRSQPRVRDAVTQVDARRQGYLATLYGSVLGDAKRGALLAEGAMALLVGVQQVHAHPSSEHVHTLLTEFRTLLGT